MTKHQHIIYGFHAVKNLLLNANAAIDKIYLLEGRNDARSHDVLQLLKDRGSVNAIAVETLPRAAIDQLTGFATHQGFVALCGSAGKKKYEQQGVEQSEHGGADSYRTLEDLLPQVIDNAFFLVLDGVKDPQNLGACLRTANAAGVHAVIAPRDNAVGLTSAVRKVACGAAEVTPFFQVTNLGRTLRFLKEQGVWIYGAAVDDGDGGNDRRASQSIFDVKMTLPLALVMGAEDKGLRHLTREQCDFLVHIPMHGTVQSLNVSVATGICLFEVVKSMKL